MKRTNEDDLLAGLIEELVRRGLGGEAPRLEAAFRLAALAHRGAARSRGEPSLVHPVAVCRLLLEEWDVRDPDLLAGALLHDAVADGGSVDLARIEAELGAEVRALVDALRRPPPAEGEDPADRDRATAERLEGAPAGAARIAAAARIDDLRAVVEAAWPETKKRDRVREARDAVLPVVRSTWPEAAAALERQVEETQARLDAGEGDLPDVGPTDLAPGAGAETRWRRSEHLSLFHQGAAVFLYHDLVGDVLQMREEVIGFLDHFAAPRLESEARAAFAPQFAEGDLDAFFEILGQHLCLLPGAEDDAAVTSGWFPVLGPWVFAHAPAGGPVTLGYRDRRDDRVVEERLSPLQGALFGLCDGSLSLPEIVARLRARFPDADDVGAEAYTTVRAWTHSDRQLLKLLPRPRSAYELTGLPPYVHSAMPYPRLRGSAAPPAPPSSLRDYHREEIASADEQFERRETTISHALRVPHPALGGRTYGAQLARRLLERGLLADDGSRRPLRIVEVGGGTGRCARALLDGLAVAAPRLYNRARYTVLELSPTLRRAQAEQGAPHAEKLEVVGGEATGLPFDDGTVDLLLANEMIADLPAHELRRDSLDAGRGEGPGYDAVRRYGLRTDDAPGLFRVNTGALELLEELARVLAPGGAAYLSEYGGPSRYPEASTHLDHTEHSIHFGHLRQAAGALGLESSLDGLAAFLGLDGSVEVLRSTQSSFEVLRAFLARRGATIEKVAYTRDMLAERTRGKVELDDLQGVPFGPCGERLLGLQPPDFHALTLRRPRQGGRRVEKVTIDF